MKILIVNGHLHVGGVEKSLINLLRAIDYTRHQVDLLLVEDLGEYIEEVPSQVRIIFFDMRPTYGSFRSVLSKSISDGNLRLAYQKSVLTLSNKITKTALKGLRLPHQLEDQYDCAIAYRVGMPLDLVSYVINAKVKCAWWHHGEFDYPDSLRKQWYEAFKKVDHLICVSETTRKLLEKQYPKLMAKMLVIPNMIIPEEVQKTAEAFFPYGDNDDRIKIVSVGRMSPEKHMIDTVEAMRALKSRGHKNLVWYLVGDGAERKLIESRIAEYGLEDSFCLVGNQSNPYPYIYYADVFVHPSWVESQGISVLEAMTLGKLCVVVKSAGTGEFVLDGYNAISAEQSISGLVDKVEEALRKGKNDMRAGQVETVESFLPSAIMPKFCSLLSKSQDI